VGSIYVAVSEDLFLLSYSQWQKLWFFTMKQFQHSCNKFCK